MSLWVFPKAEIEEIEMMEIGAFNSSGFVHKNRGTIHIGITIPMKTKEQMIGRYTISKESSKT